MTIVKNCRSELRQMHWLMELSVLLFSVLMVIPSTFAGEKKTVAEITNEARQFLRMADRVAQEEPTLYDDPQFADLQKLTMRYQRYMTSREAGDFRRLFVVPPSSLRMETVLKAFVKYADEAKYLSGELVPFVEFHLSLLTDKEYGKRYQSDYQQVLSSLWPDENDQLQDFIVFTCDYTTQPTDGFWFVVHAMRLSDELGEALFADRWIEARNEMIRESKLLSLMAIKERIGVGPRMH